MDERRPKISAIIACYRDARAIPHMLDRLSKVFETLPAEGEFVFVNDASPDDAAEVLRGLIARDPRVVAVHHSRNFGSQAAFTSGMTVATGDVVVLLDGDLQDPPELIPAFFEKWREGFEVVYGVRVKREATPFLQVAYKLFYRLFRMLSYVEIPVDAGDFSLMDRRVVQAILGMPERDRFLRGLRAWVGFRQVGVDYVRPERMFGVTTNNLFKNIAWARKGILSFSYLPLEMISFLAAATTLLTGASIFVYVTLFMVLGGAPQGFMTLLLAVLFLGSVQLLCLAIIGDYLGRVFEEVKQRPLYVVRDIWNDPRRPALETPPTLGRVPLASPDGRK